MAQNNNIGGGMPNADYMLQMRRLQQQQQQLISRQQLLPGQMQPTHFPNPSVMMGGLQGGDNIGQQNGGMSTMAAAQYPGSMHHQLQQQQHSGGNQPHENMMGNHQHHMINNNNNNAPQIGTADGRLMNNMHQQPQPQYQGSIVSAFQQHQQQHQHRRSSTNSIGGNSNNAESQLLMQQQSLIEQLQSELNRRGTGGQQQPVAQQHQVPQNQQLPPHQQQMMPIIHSSHPHPPPPPQLNSNQEQPLQFPPALQDIMQRQASGSFGLQMGALFQDNFGAGQMDMHQSQSAGNNVRAASFGSLNLSPIPMQQQHNNQQGLANNIPQLDIGNYNTNTTTNNNPQMAVAPVAHQVQTAAQVPQQAQAHILQQQPQQILQQQQHQRNQGDVSPVAPELQKKLATLGQNTTVVLGKSPSEQPGGEVQLRLNNLSCPTAVRANMSGGSNTQPSISSNNGTPQKQASNPPQSHQEVPPHGDSNFRRNSSGASVSTEAEENMILQTLRRNSQAMSSQASQSQGSLSSHGSIAGALEPDPIAEGVTMHKTSDALVVGSSSGNGGSKSNGDKRSFLDGHFAGGWQSNSDLPDRRRVNFHIIKVIERMRPDANRMSRNRLPLMAKKLEEHLYRSAVTKEAYIDPASLKRRLHLIAKGVGFTKSGGGGGIASIARGNITSGQVVLANRGMALDAIKNARGNKNQNAVPMEAVSRGPDNSSLNNAPQPQLQARANNDAPNQSQTQQLKSDGRSVSSQQDSTSSGTPKKVLQQRRRLALLRHASNCNAGSACQTKFCPQMIELWKHIRKCRDKNCKKSHCMSSRCVLNHYRQCKAANKTATCNICAPVVTAEQVGMNGDGSAPLPASGEDELDTLLLNSDNEGIDPMNIGPIKSGENNNGGSQNQNDSLMAFDTLDLDVFGEGGITGSLSPTPMGFGQPMSQQQHQGIVPVQLSKKEPTISDLQQTLQRNQFLLQQAQQQKANLFGQSQKMQQQLDTTNNPQQKQELQKQHNILLQLNNKYEEQQSLLQSEIHHQYTSLRNLQQQALQQPGSQQDETNTNPSKIVQGNVSGAMQLGAANIGQQQSAHATTSANGASILEAGASLTQVMPTNQNINFSVSNVPVTPQSIDQKCLPLVKMLMNHENGWVFREAVDPIELGIPDYFEIIEQPMDLTLVKNKLEDGAYNDIVSFEQDVKLVFENAILFNGKDSDVGRMAAELMNIFLPAIKNAKETPGSTSI